MKRIIIIGGVAAGASCATRCRRLSEDAQIILVERTHFVSFATCGIPYYVGDVIHDEQPLHVATPKLFQERFGIHCMLMTEATGINPKAKTVTLKSLVTQEVSEHEYDELVLATGSHPIRPNLPGINDFENIYMIKTIPDGRHVREWVEKHSCKKAVIVGGGYIGLEMVENLVNRGLKVSLIEGQDQVMGPMDVEMIEPIQQLLQKKGVDLYLGEMVAGFEKGETADDVVVLTKNGSRVSGQLVILGLGVRPASELAKAAALEIGVTGGIKVDQNMRTSSPHIYAAGDAVEVIDFVTNKPAVIPLAGPANRQGRIIANVIFGAEPSVFRGIQATAICKVFDMTVAMTGSSEKSLKRAGIDYEYVLLHPYNHATYYPHADKIHMKLLYAPKSGIVLGAQAVGEGEGADKRIDVISIAIQGRMTVFDLEEAELCYSPQFGSAKDAVNFAGMIAANNIRGLHPIAHWPETLDKLREGEIRLIDVRSPDEFNLGHAPDAENIPLNDLRHALEKGAFAEQKEVRVYCHVGLRGYMATRILQQNGINAKNITGGWLSFPSHEIIEEYAKG